MTLNKQVNGGKKPIQYLDEKFNIMSEKLSKEIEITEKNGNL
jgi:hypothetical protein